MVKKLFVSDCEGPLSLNDNAFELAAHFIPQGEEFFTRVSLYDDYLVEEVKKPDYHAGDTLKLIAPFLKAYGATNQKIIDFSKENILLVPGAQETVQLIQDMMPTYIISTSYQQYIQALTQTLDFPLENTYFTTIDLDQHQIPEAEIETLHQFREEIVAGADFNMMDDIFFQHLPTLQSGKIIQAVKTVGGEGKKLALQEILKANSTPSSGFLYVGDSITDVEPLRFARENNSLAISFNGNEYAIRESNLAVISSHTIITSLLADLYFKFNQDYLLQFVDAYSKDPEQALYNYRVNLTLLEQFETIFQDQELPQVEIITSKNQADITSKSIAYRKKIRGELIGGLG